MQSGRRRAGTLIVAPVLTVQPALILALHPLIIPFILLGSVTIYSSVMKGFARPWNHIGSLTSYLLCLVFCPPSQKTGVPVYFCASRNTAMAEERGNGECSSLRPAAAWLARARGQLRVAARSRLLAQLG